MNSSKLMTLKNSINTLIAQNKEVNSFIEEANKQNDADKKLIDYTNYLNQSNYNSALSLSFAYVLQFASDPTLFEQFALQDLEQLYDSFIELNDKCSDIYIDAACFADAVLDNKDKAKRIVDVGLSKLKIQLAELEELKKDLNA